MEDRFDYLDWFFAETPVLASRIDAQGRFERVSAALARRLGQVPEELRGQRPEDLATPACRTRIVEAYRPMLRRTGRLDGVPVEFVAGDGEVVELAVSSAVAPQRRGETRHSIAVYAELGGEAALVRRFRRFYRSTPAMLHTMDADGRILEVSERWLHKLGYRRDEVLGRHIRHFITDSTWDRLERGRLKRLADVADYTDVPREMLARNGQVVEVLMSASAERDAGGNARRFFVACKDVTERNEAERKLRAAFRENAALRRQLEHERDYLREEVDVSMNFGRIVGSSAPLLQLLARIDAVAQTPASVLIVGESGTGKELVAHAIHARSERAGRALVKVNCASIPDDLFESEFFGHVKGAFTGAVRDRVGRFALADGGTIFLDEVSEIPLALQGKLLRVLQEREFEPVGDDRTRVVDVRVIAATNRDLASDVQNGRFREDLYYRLSVFPVEVPPLRERGDDVLQLATHLLAQIGRELGQEPPPLTQAQAQRLLDYDWPGNVRELRNILERALILARDGVLALDLGNRARTLPARRPPSESSPAYVTVDEFRELERQNIVAALKAAHWRVAGKRGAAALLRMKPSTLSSRLRSLGIERPAARVGRPPADEH